MIAGGERINLIEMIAFDPVLEFAGLIASVLADFEHGDDDDLDLDGAPASRRTWRQMATALPRPARTVSTWRFIECDGNEEPGDGNSE